MYDLLSLRGSATPERTAVIDAEVGTEWTYAELDATVGSLAANLAAVGLERGDHVGTLLDTSVNAVQVVHAVTRLGARLVPLSTRLTPVEVDRYTTAADVERIVCDDVTEELGQAAGVPIVSVDELVDGLADPGRIEPATWTLDEPQMLPLTSGTTGEPKPVVLTAGNLLASAAASAFRLGVLPDDRWLVCLPLYHLGGLAAVIRSALYGTAVVVMEGFDPLQVGAAVREWSPSGVSLVPTMLRQLLDAGVDLSGLRFVLLGGAPAPSALIDACETRGVPVFPTYGATETASQVTTATPAEAFDHPGTVGRPLVFTSVDIVDEEGQALPDGEVGEIVVSGPTVAAGYYGDPAATERAFSGDQFRTEDAGYLDDGRLWVVGRLDDRIITGGENVHPGEVEDTLRDHPSVRDVTVVGVEDPEWGQRVAALVVAGSELDPGTLEAHCRERLAGYKCPRTILFADELPRTASGTIDREAVRDQFQ